MKYIIVFLGIICITINHKVNAQSKTKYSIGTFFGLTQNLGRRGPTEKTEVSDVRFIRPIAKTFGGSFDLKLHPKYSLGLEVGYDEFQAGYSASNNYPNSNTSTSISSGMLLIPERIALFKTGIRLVRSFSIVRGLQINTIFTPYIAYSKARPNLNDTAQWNLDERTGAYGNREVQYFRYPAYQNTGLHFVIKATAELQYKFRNNVSITLDAAYQQGFRPFVIDTVNIVRQYEPNSPQHKYWTRFSGSSVQFHFGVKYDF
ncbi:MAG: hypothetical protein QM541_17200 [Flavobacterium sp.]|nr:hypothetical protein [Flavobacterium sp.]